MSGYGNPAASTEKSESDTLVDDRAGQLPRLIPVVVAGISLVYFTLIC
jgi:hypothetical protein